MAGLAVSGAKRERLHLKGLSRKNLTMLKELGVGMTGAVYLCKIQTSERSSMIAVVKARARFVNPSHPACLCSSSPHPRPALG